MKAQWLCIVVLAAACGDKKRAPQTDKKAPEKPAATTSLGRAIDVAVSSDDVCVALASGKVACWGQVASDQITTRPQIIEGVTDAVAISSGHCVLRGAKPAMCWSTRGVSEIPGTEGARQVADDSACFLLASGSVSCWDRFAGKLEPEAGRTDLRTVDPNAMCVRSGDQIECQSSATDAREPLSIGGKATDLSCASRTCCAVTDDGHVACWGENFNGRLGDGMPVLVATPTKITGQPEMAAVYAGENFTLAVSKNERALFIWGSLGRGPQIPVKVLDDVQLVTATPGGAVATRGHEVRAVVVEGVQWTSKSLPSLPTDATAISRGPETGTIHSVCAALSDGTVHCLRGVPTSGELHWQKIAGMTDVVQLSAIRDATCGVTKTGTVACLVDERDVGDRPAASDPTKAAVIPGIGAARRVALPYVELADGHVITVVREDRHWTVKPQPELTGVTGIETGESESSPACGLKDKHVTCWSKTAPGTPTDFATVEATAVCAGNSHACLLDSKGGIWCWGDDSVGQLGLGRMLQRDTAAPVAGIGP